MQSLSSRKYDLNAALSEWIHPSYFVETFIQSLSNLSIITPLPHNLVRSDLQPVPVEVVVKPGPPTKRRRIGRRSPWKHLHGKEPCPGSTEQSNSTVATPVSRPRIPASSSTTRDHVAVDIGDYDEDEHQLPVYDILPDDAMSRQDQLRQGYMKNKFIFHKWDQGCDPNWYKGLITKYNSKNNTWWCKYMCGENGAKEYSHDLKIADYGKSGLWVLTK